MWFTRLAISRPILIWMALAAIAVLGVQVYLRLPAELNPRTEIPTLTITTIYPGAGPPEVELQVSKPLEDAVSTVPGAKDVYSSSQANVSIISMDFQVGTNLDVAAAEVRGRVDALRAQLPAEVKPPVVAKLDINALPILYLGFESDSLSLERLRTLVDTTVQPRLQRVPGVASVQVVGGEHREVRVSVDQARLALYGMTIEDVVNSLKASGRDIPGGSIERGTQETQVRLTGAFVSLEGIRQTQLLPSRPPMPAGFAPGMGAPPSNPLPVPALTVSDVATVTEGTAVRTEIDRINGHDGIGLALSKASDANTVSVVEQVNRALDDLRPTLPADFHRVVLRDDSVTVRDALEDVNATLVMGALLAMGVILLFLHNLRGTIIVSLAIPACIIATFLVIGVAGFTLNQMTLLALSLSVGILVDDSIVVLESITRHLGYGESPRQAAYNGRAEIGFADITTTLVDVVVFVPIAFMGGIVGGFFKQFGLTIATATLFSLVISFSVTPMLAARWYRSGEDLRVQHGLFGLFEAFYAGLERRYRRVLRHALRHRALVVLSGLAALGLIFLVSYSRLGVNFLPGSDFGQIAVNIEMPPGTSLNATDAVARRCEAVIRGVPDVAAVVTNVGQILGGLGSVPQQGSQFAQINVRLRDRATWFDHLLHPKSTADATRLRSDEAVAADLRARVQPIAAPAGARIVSTAIRSVQGVTSPVEIDIRGMSLQDLSSFAAAVRNRIASIPGIRDPNISVRSGAPEIQADVDRVRAAELGVPVALAGVIVRDSLTGNTDNLLRAGSQETPIRIQLQGVERNNPGDVGRIVVGMDSTGQPIPLSDIARIVPRTGPTNIDRFNGRRIVTVTANLDPGLPLSRAQAQIDAAMKPIPHPGLTYTWGGDAQTINETAGYFINALVLAVILVYIVMASLFNSLGTPFVIMFTLPMALIGALGALVITGETMSLVAAIGVIMLVGLMGRNAILLLDFTNTLRARGMARSAAIEEAGATRLRPIMMTTTATIVGMLPVALRIGRASEIRAPMAIVVIGGLLVSTILTLVVIPVLYSLFDDAVQYKNRLRGHSPDPPSSPDSKTPATESPREPAPL